MDTNDPVVGGRGGARRWHGLAVRLRRPTGIRNGGLLLILVALAAVMALVGEPPGPGRGQRLPGTFQYLPPPVGISQPPPGTGQLPAAVGPPAGQATDGGRLDRAPRRHPRRHRPGGSGDQGGTPSSRQAGGQAAPRPGGPTPAAPGPTTPAAVRVAAAAVRVTTPRVLGDLPALSVEVPEVDVEAPGAVPEAPAVRLGAEDR